MKNNLVIERLLNEWERVPELRLGQLISNVIDSEVELFYMDDEDLIRHIKEFIDMQNMDKSLK